MTPEEKARVNIDKLLEEAGWAIQDYNSINLGASTGVAVREFPLKTGAADYLLFVNRKAVGAIEAKKEGTTLSGVAEQSGKYIVGLPENIPHIHLPLPFAYESTGSETFFRDEREQDARSRRVFAFHKPQTLWDWGLDNTTLRGRLRTMPQLITEGLWEAQIEAVTNLEESFAESRPKALIQMATGSGKTFTAVTAVYRLLKFGKAKRVLFLVDRNNLGRQALREFQQYITPDDGRKLSELYNVQHLTNNTLDAICKVCITTIQRLYSMLEGEENFDAENEEQSLFQMQTHEKEKKIVKYSPKIPIEMFDFIITDECHRSIYHDWRQVLDYFDAFIIGLTATPSKQTIGFFNNNLVMEYSHDRAVADGCNVGFEVYRIKTAIGEEGSAVDAGFFVDIRDKMTRRLRWEQLDEELVYTPQELDRNVVAVDQIRKIVRTYRDRLFSEIFPGREHVPKTLIFAKSDSHAEDIVHIVREEFGKGNEFCKKITYKTTGEKPENLIKEFRISYYPRIAVTVDMVSTGTDFKALECLIFMRNVQSGVYYEQMKGRGTRVINPDDLEGITPDAGHKTHFVIVDAIGVCEHDKTDSQPLERKRYVSFDKLLNGIALGIRDNDTISSLAGRLAKFNNKISEKEKEEILGASDGKTLREMVNSLLDAVDPDKHEKKAKELFLTPSPTEQQIIQAREELVSEACAPFDDANLRNTLIDIKKRNEQIIDTVSLDDLISAGFDSQAGEKARSMVESFKQFIEDNKDELTALKIIYEQPYGKRHLTYEQIKEIAEAIKRPPYSLSTDRLWVAYEQLEKAKVKGAGPQKLLTNIISLIRFAIGESEVLEPYSVQVEERFQKWLEDQETAGKIFTEEQIEWLTMLKDHIATSLLVEIDDFDYAPFHDKGGAIRAFKVFGPKLDEILSVFNERIAG